MEKKSMGAQAPAPNPHMDGALKGRLDSLYQAVLVEHDASKFYDFFAQDCYIEINGVSFDGPSFLERIKWLRENVRSVEVAVLDCFQSEDGCRLTDLHLSKAIDNKGVQHLVLVMQQSFLNKDGKIERFFDISRILSEDSSTNVHVAK